MGLPSFFSKRAWYDRPDTGAKSVKVHGEITHDPVVHIIALHMAREGFIFVAHTALGGDVDAVLTIRDKPVRARVKLEKIERRCSTWCSPSCGRRYPECVMSVL